MREREIGRQREKKKCIKGEIENCRVWRQTNVEDRDRNIVNEKKGMA